MNRSRARHLFAENRLEVAWVGFACLNLVAMLVLITDDGPHGWETVPFHLIYVSFTLLYGYRMWRCQGHDRGHHLRVAVGRRHDAAGRAPLP